MAEFSRLVITEKGSRLVLKLLESQGVITFTKIAASSDSYSMEELPQLTALNIRQENGVSEVEVEDAETIKICAVLSNEEVTEGYYARAMGVYAADPDEGEILYGVSVEVSESGCYVPPFKNRTVSNLYFYVSVAVGNSENVNLEVDPAALVTVKQLNKVSATLDSHVNDQDNPHNVNKEQIGLGLVDNTPDAEKPVSQAQREAIAETAQKASDNLEELRQQLDEKIVEASGSIAAGICNTAKGTVVKTVSCEGFQVKDGACIMVTFVQGNTSPYIKLNVNDTGEYFAWFPIDGSRAYNHEQISKLIVAGCAYQFIYQDGSTPKWVYCGINYQDYKLLAATDKRNALKPANAAGGGAKVFFSSLGALDGNANDYNYVDALLLDTWADTGGGVANAIVARKNTPELWHYWGDHGADTWSGKKQIAYTDSSVASAIKAIQDGNGNNIAETYLPKTGGTVTGELVTAGGTSVIALSTGGTAGYKYAADIKVLGAYIDIPLEFVVAIRFKYAATRFHLIFKSSEGTDPGVTSFTYEGAECSAYLVKTAASTWGLYIEQGAWQNMKVYEYHTPNNISIIWHNSDVAEKPTGLATVKAGIGGSVKNADTVDSKHASDMMLINADVSAATVENTNLQSGFYNVEGESIGIGNGGYYSVLNVGCHTKHNYRSQLAFPYQNSITDTDAYIRTANGDAWRPWRKLIHSGNIANQSVNYAISAGSATKLATARQINGTAFDGTSNITTASWGTARNIYVSDYDGTNTGTAVAINGGGDATLKLPEKIKGKFYTNSLSITGTFVEGDGALNLCAGNGSVLTRSEGGVHVKSSSGNVFTAIYAAAFTVNSSRRYKENIVDMPESDARKLLAIEAKRFDYISGAKNAAGCIAEDVEADFPDVCSYGFEAEDDTEQKLIGIDYSKFVPYLIKLAQVQQREIDRQAEEINRQAERITRLEKIMERMEVKLSSLQAEQA